jgi:hypothetical protein
MIARPRGAFVLQPFIPLQPWDLDEEIRDASSTRHPHLEEAGGRVVGSPRCLARRHAPRETQFPVRIVNCTVLCPRIVCSWKRSRPSHTHAWRTYRRGHETQMYLRRFPFHAVSAKLPCEGRGRDFLRCARPPEHSAQLIREDEVRRTPKSVRAKDRSSRRRQQREGSTWWRSSRGSLRRDAHTRAKGHHHKTRTRSLETAMTRSHLVRERPSSRFPSRIF